MKGLVYLVLLLGAVLCSLVCIPAVAAEGDGEPSQCEYAIVKWDAPDRIYYNLPDSFELVHLRQIGVEIPKDAQDEQWCLAWAANDMAAKGWEAVNLNSRRILMRRLKVQ